MGSKTGNHGRVGLALASCAVASLLVIVLLAPSQLLMLLSLPALIPASVGLIRNSRQAVILADIILLALLLAPYLYPSNRQVIPGSLDIARLVLILTFHEFSSIYSEARVLRPAEAKLSIVEENPRSAPVRVGSFIFRGIVVGALLLLAGIISEVYLLLASGFSVSLSGFYGVAGGVMVVIAFLFLLLKLTSRRADSVSGDS